jgi:hypothetical protein
MKGREQGETISRSVPLALRRRDDAIDMRPAMFPAGRTIRAQSQFSRRCVLHIRQMFISVGAAAQPTRKG